jgi:hypothetical protein
LVVQELQPLPLTTARSAMGLSDERVAQLAGGTQAGQPPSVRGRQQQRRQVLSVLRRSVGADAARVSALLPSLVWACFG